jgi:capsid protein
VVISGSGSEIRRSHQVAKEGWIRIRGRREYEIAEGIAQEEAEQSQLGITQSS